MLWNAGVGAAREEQNGMRGGSQKRPVIPAGIEIADVEVPVVAREDQEIRFGQTAAALVEAS